MKDTGEERLGLRMYSVNAFAFVRAHSDRCRQSYPIRHRRGGSVSDHESVPGPHGRPSPPRSATQRQPLSPRETVPGRGNYERKFGQTLPSAGQWLVYGRSARPHAAPSLRSRATRTAEAANSSWQFVNEPSILRALRPGPPLELCRRSLSVRCVRPNFGSLRAEYLCSVHPGVPLGPRHRRRRRIRIRRNHSSTETLLMASK